MRALIVACALMWGGPALAQEAPPPRQTVAAVANAVREVYFDPAKGDRIADALEAEAASGAFDALTDPRDLATALTVRLKPEDAHFNVTWNPQASETAPPLPRTGGPQGPAPSGPRTPPPGMVRGNFGFTDVRILPGNVGYVEMKSFADIFFGDPDDPARKRADAVLDFLSGTDAVIIDLRDNGGGAPSMVGYLVSAFVGPDRDVYNVFHSRDGTEREAPEAFHPAPRLDVPVYVLTSGRTGSAGEAFPYTLQAADRATIVGEASGGAANPGGMVPVGGRFAVFVSGGSPRNPLTGGNWEGTGVVPDVATPWDRALETAHLLALDAIVQKDPARTDARWAAQALRTAPVAVDLAPYVGGYGEWTVTAQDGRLLATRGRRPPLTLVPLGDDVFSRAGDPGTRVTFFRNADGGVGGFDVAGPGGSGPRFRRTP
ncbi:MAG TPA: S41 family peptidase [Brevundimonas sp.]|jgi:hypothetical protein|uniref:S41 family peptidase n=1 Tax=Brevundimonas sp. TaxID=1871086 RepID=UPI002DE45F59|nr:S41 family peptidase [Brevundimonas sp.]